MTRYLLSSPSRTISCSVSGASSPDHRVMLPSNWRRRKRGVKEEEVEGVKEKEEEEE